MKISLDNIDAFIFDFDGVLTNNLVYLNQDGQEWVACSRSDGIAFDVLRKLGKPAYILSTEINPIVKARANKLKVPALQGVNDKAKTLSLLMEEQKYNVSKVMYVGNDLNDYEAMLICGFSACPADSHKKIKSISNIHLQTNGGNGVVRELLEEVLGVDFIKILFDK